MVPGDLLGVGLAALAALAIASTSVCIRLGTDEGRTTHALTVVLLCNLAVLVPLAAIVHYPEYGLTARSAGAFVAAGITGTLFGRAFYFTSIDRIGASRTEPVKATQPLHATLIAIVVLGEIVTPLHFLGIVLIIVGVGVISWESSREDARTRSRRATAKGLLFGLGAAFFFGVEPIWAKLGFADGTPVLIGLGVRMIVATFAFFAYLRARNALPSVADVTGRNARWYVAAGIVNSVFLLSYYSALEVAPVTVVLPIVQTSPLLVAVLSFVFLPVRLERVTWPLVCGAVVVVCGAITITLVS